MAFYVINMDEAQIQKMIDDARNGVLDRQQHEINVFLKNYAPYEYNDEELEDFKNTPKSMQIQIVRMYDDLNDLHNQISAIAEHWRELRFKTLRGFKHKVTTI